MVTLSADESADHGWGMLVPNVVAGLDGSDKCKVDPNPTVPFEAMFSITLGLLAGGSQ